MKYWREFKKLSVSHHWNLPANWKASSGLRNQALEHLSQQRSRGKVPSWFEMMLSKITERVVRQARGTHRKGKLTSDGSQYLALAKWRKCLLLKSAATSRCPPRLTVKVYRPFSRIPVPALSRQLTRNITSTLAVGPGVCCWGWERCFFGLQWLESSPQSAAEAAGPGLRQGVSGCRSARWSVGRSKGRGFRKTFWLVCTFLWRDAPKVCFSSSFSPSLWSLK